MVGHEIERVVNERKSLIRSAIVEWAIKNSRRYPWRENRTPYRILVAEILLRRTTSSAVLRIYDGFISSYPTLGDLARAKENELRSTLASIGYQKLRAKILKEVAMFIAYKYQGEVPNLTEDLLAIPHVGLYTAGAVLSFGHGIPAAMVDSNVERILRRLFSSSLPRKVSLKQLNEIAKNLVSKSQHVPYNFGLLDLGGLVCKYDKPRCALCPLNEFCDYPKARKQKNPAKGQKMLH